MQAALIGFVEGDTVHYFQTGFNPAMPKADLGTVVLALSIKIMTVKNGMAVRRSDKPGSIRIDATTNKTTRQLSVIDNKK